MALFQERAKQAAEEAKKTEKPANGSDENKFEFEL
jgi:hypothetical protein